MGGTGISKSQVSRLCGEIDERVNAFLDRPIEGDWPYLWLDATYVKVREAGRIVSVAVTVAVGVNTDGRREVLGMDIGQSEAETFWTAFLRKLARRGLRGVKLVISDAHEGLKAAATKVLGATAQRCRVHFMRNALAHAGKSGRQVVSALIATAFAQADAEAASTAMAPRRRPVPCQDAQAVRPHGQRRGGCAGLHDVPGRAPNQTTLDQSARTASTARSSVGRMSSASSQTKPQIKRLVGAILLEQNDEWAVQRSRYMTLESIAPIGDE